jgi:hypothetical protein
MKSSIYSMAGGGSKSSRSVITPAAVSLYDYVIGLVSGSLLLAGMALSAQGQSQLAAVAPDPNAGVAGATDLAMPAPAPKTYKNEVAVTGDFMLGEGTVTIPIGFALSKALPDGGLNPAAISGNRSSVYYGGTVSYSYGRSWYLDLSYENGVSSGSQTIDLKNTIPGATTGNFEYDDNRYQLYLRYKLNALEGTHFGAYLRGGVSLVDATLKVGTVSDIYSQTDDTTDILGNLGMGLTYSIYARPRFKLGLQVEAEAFYGARSQQSTEHLPLDYGLGAAKANIDNDLYGGVGRATLHAEWRLGHSARWRLTGDAGVQYIYTAVSYSGANAPDESLWGPYVKVGVSFVF